MGKRGPPPKPTKLRILHGSKLPINKDEPKPPSGNPKVPGFHNKETKRVHREAVGWLAELDMATLFDSHALERYAWAHAGWRECVRFLNEKGVVYPIYSNKKDPNDPEGKRYLVKYLAQFPQVAMARNFARLANLLGAEFGMTPAARTRIHSEEGQDKKTKELSRFFG